MVLCGEKAIEDPIQILRGNPRASVFYLGRKFVGLNVGSASSRANGPFSNGNGVGIGAAGQEGG